MNIQKSTAEGEMESSGMHKLRELRQFQRVQLHWQAQ